MNAAKAKKNPAKVKGAVLIMILAVMTVMIILLAGSIAVVYSTHNRVTVKYQESQAYYTMRSTLDACMNNILDSKEDALSWQKVYYYEGGADPIKVLSGSDTPNKLKRGRYEECVLYQVPVSTETDSSKEAYNQWYDDRQSAGKITNAKEVNITSADLAAAGTEYTSDSDFNGYKIQYSAPEWNSTTMKLGVDDTIVYTVDVSTIANMGVSESGETLTKMIDSNSGDKAIVKLQVLERQYDLGGSASDSIGKRFLLGDRKKDYFRIKATCEINLGGEFHTYSVYYSTKEPEPHVNGVSSLSKMNPGSKIRMINEANSLENTTYYFTNNSVTTGDVTLFGDLQMTAGGCEFVIEDGQVFYVKGTLYGGEYSTGIIIAETGATVYCENAQLKKPLTYYNGALGNFVCSGTYETEYKDGSQNLSMFVNNFRYTNGNPPGSILFTGNSYINNVAIMVGDASQANNSYATIDDTNKTITVNKNFRNLLGNCVIAGTLTFFDSSNSRTYILTDNPSNTTDYKLISNNDPADISDTAIVTFDHTKIVSADYSSAAYDGSTHKKKITLPGNLEGYGSNILELKTQRSIFNDRFDAAGTWTADGDFVQTDQTFLWNHLLPRDTLPASTPAYASGSGVPGVAGGTVKIVKDPSDGDLTNPSKYMSQTFSSVITKDNGVLELKGDYSGDILFDTTNGDITVVFNDYVKGKFYVTGENTLKIYLTSPDGTFDLGGSDKEFILVDFNTINIATKNINQLAGKPRGSKTQMYVCDDGSGNPLVSTLTLYKLDSSGINGVSPVVCAQIDAPKTNLFFNSSGGTNIVLTLADSGYTLQSVPIAIMGSVFTNSFQSGEDRGIWSMIPPDDPGDKVINVITRYR